MNEIIELTEAGQLLIRLKESAELLDRLAKQNRPSGVPSDDDYRLGKSFAYRLAAKQLRLLIAEATA
jgi:hypothetical protein